MTTKSISHSVRLGFAALGVLACLAPSANAQQVPPERISFEKGEGFKTGEQMSDAQLDVVGGALTVVEGGVADRAPAGAAYLKFTGTTDDALGTIAFTAQRKRSASTLSFAVRAPFTDSVTDRDYVLFGGAVIGLAQTDKQLMLSVPIDAQGSQWREFTLSRDLFASTLPVDWLPFQVRRDPSNGRWDLSIGGRTIASGLPAASGLAGDDYLAISGLGPVSVDDLQLFQAADSADPKSKGDNRDVAKGRVLEFRIKHDEGRRNEATDGKGRRGPAWGRPADPGATAVGPAATSAATTAAKLELFLPKP